MRPSKRCLICKMNLFSVIGIAVVAAVLSVILKQWRPEVSLLIGVCAGVLLLSTVLSEVRPLIAWFKEVGATYGNLNLYFAPLLKVLGVAYLAQFASQVCRDAGESALAMKVEIAGRVTILGLSVPVLKTVLEMIEDVLFRL